MEVTVIPPQAAVMSLSAPAPGKYGRSGRPGRGDNLVERQGIPMPPLIIMGHRHLLRADHVPLPGKSHGCNMKHMPVQPDPHRAAELFLKPW